MVSAVQNGQDTRHRRIDRKNGDKNEDNGRGTTGTHTGELGVDPSQNDAYWTDSEPSDRILEGSRTPIPPIVNGGLEDPSSITLLNSSGPKTT